MEVKETPEEQWEFIKQKMFKDQNSKAAKKLDCLVKKRFNESLTEIEKWKRLMFVMASIAKELNMKL